MVDVSTPYSTAKALFPSALPQWLNEYDAQRLESYRVYQDIYWSAPDTFKLMQRGTEASPIYIPSGRVIVNTMHRYAGKGWGIALDDTLGTPADQALLIAEFTKLFRRERMLAQYATNKLHGLMRGDWCFHIIADPLKPQGRRITIRGLDPAQYFPITDDNDVDTITGVDIIEQVIIGDKTVLKRQRYLKSNNPGHPSFGTPDAPVSYELNFLEVENFQTAPKFIKNPNQADVPQVLLPPTITTIPVYHIKNVEEPQNPFGSSELRGLERIMGAVNQAITDEELALAMEGLGVYATTAGPPVDDDGNEVPWYLGPGRVVEHATGSDFNRISGINTVGPYMDHLRYLHDWMGRASGASDVAQGVVDVAVAESGIALALRFAPIIASAEDKDLGIQATMDQFLYDLRFWLQEYEGIRVNEAQAVSTFGSKLPLDVQGRFNQLMSMYQAIPPLITGVYFRDACREMGIDIPLTVDGIAIIQEQQAFAEAADASATRTADEAAGASDQTDVVDETV